MLTTSKDLRGLEREGATLNNEQDQKRHAAALNDRLHAEGAEKFGMDWLKVHMAISGAAQEDYVPENAVGDTDIRFVALLADAAYRLLEKYELKPREG